MIVLLQMMVFLFQRGPNISCSSGIIFPSFESNHRFDSNFASLGFFRGRIPAKHVGKVLPPPFNQLVVQRLPMGWWSHLREAQQQHIDPRVRPPQEVGVAFRDENSPCGVSKKKGRAVGSVDRR